MMTAVVFGKGEVKVTIVRCKFILKKKIGIKSDIDANNRGWMS